MRLHRHMRAARKAVAWHLTEVRIATPCRMSVTNPGTLRVVVLRRAMRTITAMRIMTAAPAIGVNHWSIEARRAVIVVMARIRVRPTIVAVIIRPAVSPPAAHRALLIGREWSVIAGAGVGRSLIDVVVLRA